VTTWHDYRSFPLVGSSGSGSKRQQYRRFSGALQRALRDAERRSRNGAPKSVRLHDARVVLLLLAKRNQLVS